MVYIKFVVSIGVAQLDKTLKASKYQTNVNYNVILHSTYTYNLFMLTSYT
jgi:hypothetical protein